MWGHENNSIQMYLMATLLQKFFVLINEEDSSRNRSAAVCGSFDLFDRASPGKRHFAKELTGLEADNYFD
jgi:hypothetical protein